MMALAHFFRDFYEEPLGRLIRPYSSHDKLLGNLVPYQYFRPTYPLMVPQQTGKSEVVNTDKEFKMNIDVQHFRPEEISVKTKDNRLIINARHEERPDEHGFIMREFTRQYVLPSNVDPGEVKSSLNKDGVLCLKAPKKALEASQERAVPITHEKGDY